MPLFEITITTTHLIASPTAQRAEEDAKKEMKEKMHPHKILEIKSQIKVED